MERLTGKTLDKAIPARGWSIDEVLPYAHQIASALVAAHKSGVVHGDLKPANILLTAAGYLKLLDFGLARVLLTNKPSPSESPARRFGSKAYMAPELLLHERIYPDERSEIFSFGLIFFQMLTHRHPFGAGDRQRIAKNICYAAPRELPAKFDQALSAMITRCLQKDPERRFQSMTGVMEALTSLRTRPEIVTPSLEVKVPKPVLQDARAVARALKQMGYANLAHSREALTEVENLIQSGISESARLSIIHGLRDMLLTVPGRDGLSGPIRQIRRDMLRLLRQAARNQLAVVFKPQDLEDLDLYGMDFSDADMTGLSLNGSFLVEARFEGKLVGGSFAGAYLRNVHFGGADLRDVDFTDADWFNAVGLTESQLLQARRQTLRMCPETIDAILDDLPSQYGFPFESWSRVVQTELKATWQEYLRPGGLRDIVRQWRDSGP